MHALEIELPALIRPQCSRVKQHGQVVAIARYPRYSGCSRRKLTSYRSERSVHDRLELTSAARTTSLWWKRACTRFMW